MMRVLPVEIEALGRDKAGRVPRFLTRRYTDYWALVDQKHGKVVYFAYEPSVQDLQAAVIALKRMSSDYSLDVYIEVPGAT